MILNEYLLGLEPDTSNLKRLSDFFKVTESELFSNNKDYNHGTVSTNNNFTKIYIGLLTILSVISIFNIGFIFVTSDTQTGLLVQTIMTATSFLSTYIIKYYKDVSSLLKIKYNYFLYTCILSLNLYVFLIH